MNRFMVCQVHTDTHSGYTKEIAGLFISVGATKGTRLFGGTLLRMEYFFDVLDVELWNALLYRGLDFEGDALTHQDYL